MKIYYTAINTVYSFPHFHDRRHKSAIVVVELWETWGEPDYVGSSSGRLIIKCVF